MATNSLSVAATLSWSVDQRAGRIRRAPPTCRPRGQLHRRSRTGHEPATLRGTEVQELQGFDKGGDRGHAGHAQTLEQAHHRECRHQPSDDVWLSATLAPCSERPVFSTTTGLSSCAGCFAGPREGSNVAADLRRAGRWPRCGHRWRVLPPLPPCRHRPDCRW